MNPCLLIVTLILEQMKKRAKEERYHVSFNAYDYLKVGSL